MPRRRLRRTLAAIALLVAAAGWLVGCTSTVRPPDGPLVAPTTVFLAFDDRHRGLLLPGPDRGFVEFDYGEWAWYAEGRDAWYRAFPAMLWPTAGALGRRVVDERDGDGLRQRWPWMRLQAIRVEAARASALRDRLDGAYTARLDELRRNEAYGIDFVPYDQSFWCLFNCNDAVSAWLEELGCRVSWVPMRIDLEVASPNR